MSGGHFDYKQYAVDELADQVEKLVSRNEYPPEIMDEFRNGAQALKVAAAYVQRIDWLVSGDDGEDSFTRRLQEQLSCLITPTTVDPKET